MTRCFALVLVLLLAFVSDGLPALGAEQSASINTVIPAGKWKVVKLRNLPKGASLAIQIVSDGEIVVLLLEEEAIQSFPDVERPLFRGSERTAYQRSEHSSGGDRACRTGLFMNVSVGMTPLPPS